jgi:hypothetical protein
MLVLLDENRLSRKLKQPIADAGHSVFNVDNMGWRGTKDRDLLVLADSYPFDIFITADKNLPYQQNVSTYQLRIIVLNTTSTKPDRLLPLIEQACLVMSSLVSDSITTIDENLQVNEFQP